MVMLDRVPEFVKSDLKFAGAGSCCALLGGAAWLWLAGSFGHEAGYFAWGVGSLVGLGARWAGAGAGCHGHPRTVAVTVALLAALLARYHVAGASLPPPEASILSMVTINEESWISLVADEIVAGEEVVFLPLDWPEGGQPELAMWEEDYPVQVWAAATARWHSFPPEEQQRRIKAHQRMVDEFIDATTARAHRRMFRETFNIGDCLWLVLGCVTAYVVATPPTEE